MTDLEGFDTDADLTFQPDSLVKGESEESVYEDDEALQSPTSPDSSLYPRRTKWMHTNTFDPLLPAPENEPDITKTTSTAYDLLKNYIPELI